MNNGVKIPTYREIKADFGNTVYPRGNYIGIFDANFVLPCCKGSYNEFDLPDIIKFYKSIKGLGKNDNITEGNWDEKLFKRLKRCFKNYRRELLSYIERNDVYTTSSILGEIEKRRNKYEKCNRGSLIITDFEDSLLDIELENFREIDETLREGFSDRILDNRFTLDSRFRVFYEYLMNTRGLWYDDKPGSNDESLVALSYKIVCDDPQRKVNLLSYDHHVIEETCRFYLFVLDAKESESNNVPEDIKKNTKKILDAEIRVWSAGDKPGRFRISLDTSKIMEEEYLELVYPVSGRRKGRCRKMPVREDSMVGRT